MQLSKRKVLEVISLNPGHIARKSLIEVFGLKKKETHKLDRILKKLRQQGDILQAGKAKYAASSPMSDLVIAKIASVDSKGRSQLVIQGLCDEFNYSVLASQKETKKWKAHPGQSFLVNLRRYNKTELRARFLEKSCKGQRPSIDIAFKKAANDNAPSQCQALDTNIKTRFKALGIKSNDIPSNSIAMKGQIPPDYNPFDPALFVSRLSHESKSGEFIPDILIRKYKISTAHSPEALEEAKELARLKPDMTLRRDMRDLPILVIDPEKAFDRDDGLYVSYNPETKQYISITVISDVAERVRPGTSTAREAKKIGNSYFFNHDQIAYPMLPDTLVQACSLHEGYERPVIFCQTLWDSNGQEIESHIGLGVIASQKCLSYKQMQAELNAAPENASHAGIDIQTYQNFLRMIAVSKDMTPDEQAKISSCSSDNTPDAGFLVHFLMTHTNLKLARFLKDNKLPALYRVHKPKQECESTAAVYKELKNLGVCLDKKTDELSLEDLNHIKNQLRAGELDETMDPLLHRLMGKAHYTLTPEMHYNLQAESYVHGTSPIRRVADLIVQKSLHRVLKPSPKNQETGLSESEEERLEHIAENVNSTENLSELIQRDYNRFHFIQDLKRHKGSILKTYLRAVHSDRIELIGHKDGLVKVIESGDLPKGWELNPQAQKISINPANDEHGAQVIKINDTINGILKSVDTSQASWEFEIQNAKPAASPKDNPSNDAKPPEPDPK